MANVTKYIDKAKGDKDVDLNTPPRSLIAEFGVVIPPAPGKRQRNAMSTFGNSSFGAGTTGLVDPMATGMLPGFGFPLHMRLPPYTHLGAPQFQYNYPPPYPRPFNDYSGHSPQHHSTSHRLDVSSSDGPDIPPSEFPSLEAWLLQLDADRQSFPQSRKFHQYTSTLANMGIDRLDVLYQACKEHRAKGLVNLDLGIPYGHAIELYNSMEKEMKHISKSLHAPC